MGAVQSNQLRSLANHLSPGPRWTVVTKQANKNVVKSSDGTFADEYTLTIEPYQSIRNELETYSYRKAQDLPLVRVLAAEIVQVPSSPGFCSGGMYSHGRVLTERIKYVLADSNQMSFPEALYCLSESIIGFRQLHQKVGPFQITDRMIGVTSEGFVKVWMNDNFALNHPSTERISPFTTTDYLPTDNLALRSEIQMVKDLFKVVQYHTEDGHFPSEWELEKLSRPHMTFLQANRMIQAYVSNHSIFVPDRVSDGKVVKITRTPVSKPGSARVIQTETVTITQNVPNNATVAPVRPVMIETQVIQNIKPQSATIRPSIKSKPKQSIKIEVAGQNFVRTNTPTAAGHRPSSFPAIPTGNAVVHSNLTPVFIGPPDSNPMRNPRVLMQPSEMIHQSVPSIVRVSQKSTPSVHSPSRKSTPNSSAIRPPSQMKTSERKATPLPPVIFEDEIQPASEIRNNFPHTFVRQVESIPVTGTITGMSGIPSHPSIIHTEHSQDSSIQAFIPGPPVATHSSFAKPLTPSRLQSIHNKIGRLNRVQKVEEVIVSNPSPNNLAYLNRDSAPLGGIEEERAASVMISGISSGTPSKIKVAEAIS